MQFVYFHLVWLQYLLLNTASSRDFPRRLAASYSKLDSAKALTEMGQTQAASAAVVAKSFLQCPPNTSSQ